MHRRITYSLFLLTLLTGMGSFGPPFGRLSTAQTVKNGDFSNGLTGWTQRIISGGIFAGFPKFLTFSSLRCLPSQQGNPFFALDVPGDADGILEQQVTIPPASVTNGAVLSLRSWGSNEPVTVTISIVPTGQAEVILESYRPPLIENFPNCTGNLPVVKSYDLAAFARQTVTLRLRGTCMRVVGPCFNGAFANFDDVSLENTPGGPPLAGLTLWLKADAGVTTDGTNGVSQWADQSGAGHDASQATAFLRPLLVPNVLNGLPALRFNGQDDWLGIAGQVFTSQQFTIVTLVNDLVNDTSRVVDHPGFREIFSNWSPANQTTSVFLGTLQNGAQTRVRFTDDIGGANDPLIPQGGVGPVANPRRHFVLTGLSDTADAFVYQNNRQLVSLGMALSLRDLTTAYNVATQGTVAGFWQGDIVEILAYDRALGGSQVEQALTYLRTKYAILPNVPSVDVLPLPGDIDGNQAIDQHDEELSLQRLVGLDPADSVNVAAAGDLDADGMITNIDAVIIAGIRAGRIAPPLDRQQLNVVDNGNGSVTIQAPRATLTSGSVVNIQNVTANLTGSTVTQADGSFSVTIATTPGLNVLRLDVNSSPAKVTVFFSPL